METRSLKSFGPKKVLIIDDDEDLRSHLKAFFELEAYQVLEAKNGLEAMDLLKKLKSPELPDLILVDYMMPVMDGIQFSNEICLHPALSSIPLVMLTASNDLRGLSQKANVQACIDKTTVNLERITFHFIHRHHNSRHSFLA